MVKVHLDFDLWAVFHTNYFERLIFLWYCFWRVIC